jgi:hypothetical protein
MMPKRHARDMLGLANAAKAAGATVRLCSDQIKGSEELRSLLRRDDKIKFHPAAGWTLRALSAGFTSSSEEGKGNYGLVMESLTAFCSKLSAEARKPTLS